MAMVRQQLRKVDDEDALIARHIAPHPDQPSPDEAILVDSGVCVWAVIGHLRGFDVAQTAHDYDLPVDAVEAALAWYHRYQSPIDARLEANDLAFRS